MLSIGSLATAQEATPNQLTDEEKKEGWTLLFDGKTTNGWRSFKKSTFPEKGWAVEDGWLHCLGTGGGEIITDKQFTDFEFQWEWKLSQRGNSGVKYFVTEQRERPLGHEYQLIDENNEPDAKQGSGKRVTGSFYDVIKPGIETTKLPVGAINSSRIVVRGNHVEHYLNTWKILEYECGSEDLKKALAQSKFKDTADFGKKIKAHILLQDHHTEIWFRNIKIREL